jgi:hypothetical protein
VVELTELNPRCNISHKQLQGSAMFKEERDESGQHAILVLDRGRIVHLGLIKEPCQSRPERRNNHPQ